MQNVKIPADIAHAAQVMVNRLNEQVSGLQALVVASVDGFDVASHVVVAAEAEKMAAMASSFAALGVVVAQESQLGSKEVLTLEAENGYVVMLDIPLPDYPMILSMTASKSVVLAQLLYHAKAAIKDLVAR